MVHHRLPLKKNEPSSKYSWKERVEIHLAIARSKYGRLVEKPSALKAKESNEPVTDYDSDIGYYGPATLGGQQFQLLFDTGSADLWVPRVGYNNGDPTNHNVFNPKKSSTFQTENQKFAIQYGTGSTSGIAASDTFDFGGFEIQNQAFGLADTVSSDFKTSPFDGILGMAFDQLSELQKPTPFQNLVNDHDVSSSVFGFLLGREKDGTNNKSELILGGVDPKFAKSIKYNKVVDKRGFWQIALDGAQVDGNTVEISGNQAIIDTGTTLVIIPPEDADAIHNAIPGSTKNGDTYLIPTNTTAVVSFTFGGINYNINTEDLVVDDAGNGLSVSGIQAENLPGQEGTWLVGDVFLKNVFNAYDINKAAVGFAPLE